MADMNDLPPDTPEEFRPESLLGSTFGGTYRLVRVLGMGGMATVYEATRLRDGSRCAFKLLLPDQAVDATALERFRREAEFGRRLKSPNVVEVLDYAQPAITQIGVPPTSPNPTPIAVRIPPARTMNTSPVRLVSRSPTNRPSAQHAVKAQ